MTTELPLFQQTHVPSAGDQMAAAAGGGGGIVHSDLNMQEATLHDDAFLQELLGTPDDLLSSFLEANGSTEPPLNFDFDINPLLNLPATSPIGSDISTSETSHAGFVNRANSPGSLTSVSDTFGDSPANSPHLLSGVQQPYQSVMGLSDPTLGTLMASTGIEPLSCSPTALSPDVKIDVDYMATTRASSSPSSTTDVFDRQGLYDEASPGWNNSSDRKAHTLLLTEDEKKLLAEEGVALPTDMPLTKAEQKDLKRVRRKIKNKISAQESRKRKKEYVDGLEDRVKICTDRNKELKKEVDCLKHENSSLMAQLKKLQAMVTQYNPSRIQAGSVLLVIVMSFSMFFVPKLKQPGLGHQVMRGFSRSSRALLFTETDEFGNVIDPDSGLIISPAGGQSPNFPPPWVHQTPALDLFPTRTRLYSDELPPFPTEERAMQNDPELVAQDKEHTSSDHSSLEHRGDKNGSNTKDPLSDNRGTDREL